MRPAAPLWVLLPALVLLPVLALLPGISHGGGWELVGQFAAGALRPSLDPLVLGSVLQGLAVTAGIALLGWAGSLVLGLALGIASSRVVWRTCTGRAAPADWIRRLLALPRSIHELLWGLLLLQLVGLQPAVAVVAIAIPFGALVARVVSDLLDALPTASLEALRSGGAPAPAALLTALGPPLLPQVISYSGYRLECALRSATLLGVFGLGGLGTELRLTLQSLAFAELWTGLWLLLAVMLLLEALLGWLRRRWAMPARLGLRQGSVGRQGQEMVAVALALLPLLAVVAWRLEVRPAGLLQWQGLPPLGPADWGAVAALPWPGLVGNTLLLALIAAALAVGLAPLLLLLVAPWPAGGWLVRGLWALGRLWPPPLTALLLLFVLQPGVLTGALALAFHNLGILGRLLLEAAETSGVAQQQALVAAGTGPRLALLYGRFSGLARPYLAYGAYRTDVILRESVVVGLVGATGLGSQLLEALSSFAADQLLALVLAYALLTLLGEDLSDRARLWLLETPMVMAIPRKLVALGDSGVFGWGDPLEGGWCERLRRHWMELPGGPVLYNLGVRGDGLERLAARLSAEVGCRGELRRQVPQGILLGIGLNDAARVGRADGRPQLDAEGFLFGLQQLLHQARAIAPVHVIGLTPVDEEAMPYAEVLWYSLNDIRRYEGLLEEACLGADVPFLPLLDGLLADPAWPQWLDSDGLHLNSEGHRQVYERVRRWPALLAWADLQPLHGQTPLAC